MIGTVCSPALTGTSLNMGGRLWLVSSPCPEVQGEQGKSFVQRGIRHRPGSVQCRADSNWWPAKAWSDDVKWLMASWKERLLTPLASYNWVQRRGLSFSLNMENRQIYHTGETTTKESIASNVYEYLGVTALSLPMGHHVSENLPPIWTGSVVIWMRSLLPDV